MDNDVMFSGQGAREKGKQEHKTDKQKGLINNPPIMIFIVKENSGGGIQAWCGVLG